MKKADFFYNFRPQAQELPRNDVSCAFEGGRMASFCRYICVWIDKGKKTRFIKVWFRYNSAVCGEPWTNSQFKCLLRITGILMFLLNYVFSRNMNKVMEFCFSKKCAEKKPEWLEKWAGFSLSLCKGGEKTSTKKHPVQFVLSSSPVVAPYDTFSLEKQTFFDFYGGNVWIKGRDNVLKGLAVLLFPCVSN